MPPGLALHLAPHDPVTSGVLYCGLPDWQEMRLVLDYLRAGDVMLDVGANVGLYSLLAASIGGVRVKAFEPDDGARRIAEANVARNGLGGLVEISAHAVGAAAGSSAFSTGLGPMNRLMPEGTSRARKPASSTVRSSCCGGTGRSSSWRRTTLQLSPSV
jgi:hypothetical protein